MCPACMAATAMLAASAVSTGGAVAVLANKLRAKEIARIILGRQQKEKRRGATHEQVNLMLHLYALRREAKLREAQEWMSVPTPASARVDAPEARRTCSGAE
jgi:hypothetical protein